MLHLYFKFLLHCTPKPTNQLQPTISSTQTIAPTATVTSTNTSIPSHLLPGSLVARATQPLSLSLPPPFSSTNRRLVEPVTPLPVLQTRPLPLPGVDGSNSKLSQLPSPVPKRRRTVTTRESSTSLLQVASTLDTIMERLDDIEYKLQHKVTQVCEAQTQDLMRRVNNAVAEESFFIRQYTRDLVATVQDNLLKK